MITVLPDVIASQIAAGEVVDRPVSVVRELVDNAIDSGASSIEVSFDRGGLATVIVSDNGCGMSPQDAQLAFHRHATSKLLNLSDLDNLKTRGFRGEALPSIASVARVSVQTRLSESEVGYLVRVEGGHVVETSSVTCQPGTRVEVRHLFYNTPARRKFLRSPRAEASRIVDWVKKTSLGVPHVRFRITQDGESICFLEEAQSEVHRAQQFLSGSLATLERIENGTSAKGFVTFGAHGRSSFDGVVVCVNGRVVSDRIVVRAIKQACKGLLHGSQQPAGIIFLTLPPETVDVNVHPQKSEVRFADGQSVFRLVYGAMTRALTEFKAIPQVMLSIQESSRPAPFANDTTYDVRFSGDSKNPFSSGGRQLSSHSNAALDISQDSFSYQAYEVSPRATKGILPREASSHLSYSSLRYIGTISACYLLCEGEDGLVVVDMHAAHERINYNRIFSAAKEKLLTGQPLLLPLEVALSHLLWEEVQGQTELLQQCGLLVEFPRSPFVLVREVPEFLLRVKDKCSLVRELLESLATCASGNLDEMLDAVVARLACHSSVRSGQRLNSEEVYALFSDLDAAESGAACPHGRPVAIHVTTAELERLFGRA